MRIRRYALLAVIVVLALAAAVLPQTPPGRAWLVQRAQAILASNGIELRAARTSGNPWRGLRFVELDVRAPGIDVEARSLELRYFLPSLITGELPLSIAADGVRGRVDVDALELTGGGGGAAPVRVRLETLALADAELDVGDVPYAIPDLAIDEIRLAGGGDGLDVEALLTTPDGSARLTGAVRLDPPRADFEVRRADLRMVRPWWRGVTGGVVSGRLKLADGAIEADLDVRAGSLRELGLDATDIEGTIRYDHPRVNGSFSGTVLGGRADVEGDVDIEARQWRADATGDVALADTGSWLARGLELDPGPWLEGRSAVELSASGWRSVELQGQASGAGRLFGRPLEDLEAAFSLGPLGVSADASARWSEGAVDVAYTPLGGRTSQLAVSLADAAVARDVRGGAEAALTLGPAGLDGRIDAALDGRLAGRNVALEADAVTAPDAPWELFVSGSDDAGGTLSGAFVVDGASIDGGASARMLRLPGVDGRPTVTLRASGPIADLPLRIEVGGDAPVVLAVDGVGRLASDLRGSATARLREARVEDIDGRFGEFAIRGTVAPGSAWRVDGSLDPTRLHPAWAAAEPIELGAPRIEVVADPRSSEPEPDGAPGPARRADGGSPLGPIRVTADVDLGRAVVGPASVDLPDLRMTWDAPVDADDRALADADAAGEPASPPRSTLRIASRDDAASLRASFGPAGTDAQFAGIPLDYGGGGAPRRLALAGTVRSGGDGRGVAIDARAVGDGIEVVLEGATATTLRASARATPGLALGPFATRAPLSLAASMGADRTVDLDAELGSLRIDATGRPDGSGDATIATETTSLGFTSDGTDLTARGELDLGAVLDVVAWRDGTLPALEGRLTTDVTAAWSDLVGTVSGTADLRLSAPAVATASFAADAGRVRADLASEALRVQARGSVWPEVALAADVGPFAGLELRGGILRGGGTLPAVAFGRTELPELAWSLGGTVGEAAGGAAARDLEPAVVGAPAERAGSAASVTPRPTADRTAPSDLARGRARLTIGASSAAVAWGDGWSLDAALDQAVALGDAVARLSGSVRADAAAPGGRVDLILADPNVVADDATPWLRARGSFADIRLSADLPATVAAALAPSLPGGIAPRGRVVLEGTVQPAALAYDLEGSWDAAPLRLEGRGSAFEAALDVPPPAGDAGRSASTGTPSSDGAGAPSDGSPAGDARTELDGTTGPLSIRAVRRDGSIEVALEARQAPIAPLAARFDGLPADLRTGATASALGLDGSLALATDGADAAWSGELRVALRSEVDRSKLPADVTGAVAIRGDGAEVRVAADLRVTPTAARGEPLRVDAEGLLAPRPNVRIDLAYAGVEAAGDLRWPEGASSPTIDGRLRVPGVDGPVALAPLAIAVRGDASGVRFVAPTPSEDAATSEARIDLHFAEDLGGTARIPLRILDRAVVADLVLGGTIGSPLVDLDVDGAVRGSLRFADDRLEGVLRVDPSLLLVPAAFDGAPEIRIEAERSGRWRAELAASARWARIPATLEFAVDGDGLGYSGRGLVAVDGGTLAELSLSGQGVDARLEAGLGALEAAAVASLSREFADLVGAGGATLQTAPFSLDVDATLDGTVAGLPSRIEARGSLAGLEVDATVAGVRATLRPRPSGGIALTARAEDTDLAGFVDFDPNPVAQLRGRVSGRTLRVDLAPSDRPLGAESAAGFGTVPLRLDATLADVRVDLVWAPATGTGADRLTLALDAGTELLPVAVDVGAALDLASGAAPHLALNAQLGATDARSRVDVALQGSVAATLDLVGSLRSPRLDVPLHVEVDGAPGAARLAFALPEPGGAFGDRDAGLRATVQLDGATVAAVGVRGSGRVAGTRVEVQEAFRWQTDGDSSARDAAGGFRGRVELERPIGRAASLHLAAAGRPESGALDVEMRLNGGPATLATLEARLPPAPWAVDAPLVGSLRVDAGTRQRLLVEADLAGAVRAPTLEGSVRLRGVVAADGSVTYADRRADLALAGDGVDLNARLDGGDASLRARVDELPAVALLDLLPSGSSVPGLVDAAISLDLDLSGSLDGGLASVRGRIDPLRIATPTSRIEGRASIDERLLATLRADIDLAETSSRLSGRLAGPVVVQGDPLDPWNARIDASLAAEDVAARGLAERFEAALLVRGPVRGPEFVATLDGMRGTDDAGSLRLEIDPAAATGRLRSDLRVGPVTTDVLGTWNGDALAASGRITLSGGAPDADAERGVAIDPGPDASLLLRGFGGLDGWSGSVAPLRGAASFRGPLDQLADVLDGTAVIDVGPLLGPDARRFGLGDLEPASDRGEGTEPEAAGPADANGASAPTSVAADPEAPWLRLELSEATVAGVRFGDVGVRASADGPATIEGDRISARVGLSAPYAWTAHLAGVGLPGGLAGDADLRGAVAPAQVSGRLDLWGAASEEAAVDVDLGVDVDLATHGGTVRLTGTASGGRARAELRLADASWSGAISVDGARIAGATLDLAGDVSGPSARPVLRATTALDGPVRARGSVRLGRDEISVEQRVDIPGARSSLTAGGTVWPEPSLALRTDEGTLELRAAGPDDPLVASGSIVLAGPWGDLALAGRDDPDGGLAIDLRNASLAAGLRTRIAPTALADLGALARAPIALEGTGALVADLTLEASPVPMLRAQRLRYELPNGRARVDLNGTLELGARPDAPGTGLRGVAIVLPSATSELLAGGLTLAAGVQRTPEGAWLATVDEGANRATLRVESGPTLALEAALDRAGARLDADVVARPETGLEGRIAIGDLSLRIAGIDAALQGDATVSGSRLDAEVTAALGTPNEQRAPGAPRANLGTVDLAGFVDLTRWLPASWRPEGTGSRAVDTPPYGGLLRLRTVDLASVGILRRRAPNARLPLSGTLEVRDGVALGTFVAPEAALGSVAVPISATLTGRASRSALRASVQGRLGASTFTVEADGVRAGGTLRLERFPVHALAEAAVGDLDAEARATGVLRWSLPYAAPVDGELRLATERVELAGARGTARGSVTLDYHDRQLELRDVGFRETGGGSGTWRAAGTVGADALDLELVADGADFSSLLDLVPVLAPFGATAAGSFSLRAEGRPTEPTATFSAERVTIGIAGGSYALEQADVRVEAGHLVGTGRASASHPVDGTLDLEADAALSIVPFTVRDAELRFEGRLAVPALGTVDAVQGRLTSDDGRPRLEATGMLGAPLRLTGTLSPLALRLAGTDVRLEAPQWYLERGQADLDVRLDGEPGGVVVGGTVDVDTAAFALGLRTAASGGASGDAASGATSAAGERASRAARERVRFDALRVRAPRSLTLDENFGSLEARADLTLRGTAAEPTLDGSAEAIRGNVRFSGRDFTLRIARAVFERSRGVFPRLELLAATSFETSDVTASGGAVRFVEPRGAPRFDVTLAIDGDVQPTPGQVRPFAVEVDPELASPARVEIVGGPAATAPRALANDELLQLVTLGRVDLGSTAALEGDLATTVAQSALDTAVDLLFLTELQQALGDALGVDVLELRTSRISSLLSGTLEDPFSVSLRIGQYLAEGVFASLRIGNIDAAGEIQALSNEVGLRYELGPVALDLAGRVDFPTALSEAPVPSLNATVGFAVTPFARIETGLEISSARQVIDFGVSLRW